MYQLLNLSVSRLLFIFEILVVVTVKITEFYNVTPCSQVGTVYLMERVSFFFYPKHRARNFLRIFIKIKGVTNRRTEMFNCSVTINKPLSYHLSVSNQVTH